MGFGTQPISDGVVELKPVTHLHPSFPFKCEGLIDQDRIIGSDPVGHACYSNAVFEMPNEGPLLCKECAEGYKIGAEWLTVRGLHGMAFQMKAMEWITTHFKSILEKHGRPL